MLHLLYVRAVFFFFFSPRPFFFILPLILLLPPSRNGTAVLKGRPFRTAALFRGHATHFSSIQLVPQNGTAVLKGLVNNSYLGTWQFVTQTADPKYQYIWYNSIRYIMRQVHIYTCIYLYTWAQITTVGSGLPRICCLLFLVFRRVIEYRGPWICRPGCLSVAAGLLSYGRCCRRVFFRIYLRTNPSLYVRNSTFLVFCPLSEFHVFQKLCHKIKQK